MLDKWPETTGKALNEWTYSKRFGFFEPGRPIQDAFVEKFNGRLSDECPTDQLRSTPAGRVRELNPPNSQAGWPD